MNWHIYRNGVIITKTRDGNATKVSVHHPDDPLGRVYTGTGNPALLVGLMLGRIRADFDERHGVQT
jgi:hypothetical protein